MDQRTRESMMKQKVLNAWNDIDYMSQEKEEEEEFATLFGLVGFYEISTIAGHLMANSFLYIY